MCKLLPLLGIMDPIKTIHTIRTKIILSFSSTVENAQFHFIRVKNVIINFANLKVGKILFHVEIYMRNFNVFLQFYFINVDF